MKRADLAKRAVEQLRRLPPPYDSHYGVVPARPPTASIALGEALAAVEGAQRALVEAEIITRELKDPFLVSRILTRKEALSSSAIEDTHSTLDALLSLEETGEGESRGIDPASARLCGPRWRTCCRGRQRPDPRSSPWSWFSTCTATP